MAAPRSDFPPYPPTMMPVHFKTMDEREAWCKLARVMGETAEGMAYRMMTGFVDACRKDWREKHDGQDPPF